MVIEVGQIAGEAAARAVETKAVLARQRYITFIILALAAWTARGFLLPLAWASVLAIAIWPLYRRAIARAPRRQGAIAALFTLATALLVIFPISIAAVALVQESQAAISWVQHVQQTGLAEPAWLGSVPLVGGRADQFWREHVGSPQACSAAPLRIVQLVPLDLHALLRVAQHGAS